MLIYYSGQHIIRHHYCSGMGRDVQHCIEPDSPGNILSKYCVDGWGMLFAESNAYNRQNPYYWAMENLTCPADVLHQKYFSINVWCGIYNNRRISPVFYQATLTGARYLELLYRNIRFYFVENLSLLQIRNVWFQHDGTSAHKTSLVKQCLVEEIGEQIIG